MQHQGHGTDYAETRLRADSKIILASKDTGIQMLVGTEGCQQSNTQFQVRKQRIFQGTYATTAGVCSLKVWGHM